VIRVEVVYALADEQFAWSLELIDGASVGDALARVADAPALRALNLDEAPVGIFGEAVNRAQVLVDGDRVEIYRSLLVDPKEARRLRAADEHG
jgi:uncharacterized protein